MDAGSFFAPFHFISVKKIVAKGEKISYSYR